MNRRDFNKLSTMLVATAAFPAMAAGKDEGYLVTTENVFVDNLDLDAVNTMARDRCLFAADVATIFVDKVGDRFTGPCLKSMADQINAGSIPLLDQHDHTKPVGMSVGTIYTPGDSVLRAVFEVMPDSSPVAGLAWDALKHGLYSSVTVGFRPGETFRWLSNGGIFFNDLKLNEMSLSIKAADPRLEGTIELL